MDFGKCSKSAKEDCSSCPLFSSSLCFSSSPLFFPCILWTTLAKDYEAPKLGFFMNLSFQKLCHELYTTRPQSRIALVIKKLSKTPKLNTIWLELIARVLNMLIGLKGNNYYSRVFKRVNYKLQNSTFWVVINHYWEYLLLSTFINSDIIHRKYMIILESQM